MFEDILSQKYKLYQRLTPSSDLPKGKFKPLEAKIATMVLLLRQPVILKVALTQLWKGLSTMGGGKLEGTNP